MDRPVAASPGSAAGTSVDWRVPASGPRRCWLAAILLPLAAILLPLAASRLAAQTIRGQITDAESGRPIAGALVLLLDDSAGEVGATVSTALGFYRLKAPRAGRYQVRVERVGFDDTTSALLELGDGESLSLPLATVSRPIELAPLVVRARGECRVRPEEGHAAYALWGEARKALRMSVWAERNLSFVYRAMLYSAVVDPRGQPRGVRLEWPVTLLGRHPFRAAPREQLEAQGYRQVTEGGAYYYGPDAAILLSDQFLDAHCFRVVPAEDGEQGLLGLAFEPAGETPGVDVQGVLWLDSGTARLRFVEFTFTGLPRSLRGRGVAGRVDFERLETGLWVVSRWWIRAPLRESGGAGGPGRRDGRGLLLREDGGYVTGVEAGRSPGARVERVEPSPDVLSPHVAEALESLRARERLRDSAVVLLSDRQPLPRAVEAAMGLFGPAPDSAQVARLLASHPALSATAPRMRLAVAALWRRSGEPEMALETLATLSDRGPEAGVLALERARSLFLLGLPPEAADEFWAACSRMDAGVRRELWRDLRGLATPDERVEWSELATGPAACPWIRRFVVERARRMGVSEAERLALHYERLRHARRFYWLREPRKIPDLTDGLGRLQPLEVDDRGLVYLRLGEPDRLTLYTPPAACAPTSETWVYSRPDGPRYFHFSPVSPLDRPSDPPRDLTARDEVNLRRTRCAPPPVADYRLKGSLAATFGPLGPLELLDRRRLLADLYSSRGSLDASFTTQAYRFRTQPDGALLSELARERREVTRRVAEIMQTVPDVPSVRPRLRSAWEVVRFRQPRSDLTVFWIMTSTRAGDLEPRRVEGGMAYRMTASLVYDQGEGIGKAEGNANLLSESPLSDEDGVTVRFPAVLEPGRYPFTLTLRDENTADPVNGNWDEGVLHAFELARGLPEVSGIAVAADSGGHWSRDSRVYLDPTPLHRVADDGSLHVYFEVYGIGGGREYEVEVRLVPEELSERLYTLEPDDVAFRVNFPARMPVGPTATGRHHLRLDLRDTDPGSYTLGVRVTDVASTVSSLPSTTQVERP